jgi:hypothetical protein
MKLPRTEKYLKQGIKMKKLINQGFLSNTYDVRTVYDLEEAIELNCDYGWFFVDYDQIFHNLALFLYRDLKDLDT